MTVVYCAIPDCKGVATSRGWCRNHYQRWHRYGHPLGTPETSRTRRNENSPNFDVERKTAGCIVSFEHADGRTFVIARQGQFGAALREACDVALQIDPTFRVVAISSPQLIAGDLRGRQGRGLAEHVVYPETALLTKVGRRAMLHPRMVGDSNGAKYREKLRTERRA